MAAQITELALQQGGGSGQTSSSPAPGDPSWVAQWAPLMQWQTLAGTILNALWQPTQLPFSAVNLIIFKRPCEETCTFSHSSKPMYGVTNEGMRAHAHTHG